MLQSNFNSQTGIASVAIYPIAIVRWGSFGRFVNVGELG
jgi:hypothetical protein